MPELPEVEVTRRGIAPALAGRRLTRTVMRVPALRYPLPPARQFAGKTLVSVSRRGKYLLLDFSSDVTPASGHESPLKLRSSSGVVPASGRTSSPSPRSGGGHLLLHLGMSGSLRLVPPGLAPEKHDHVDLVFGGIALRLRDPRRFGALLWLDGDPRAHPLLASLGVEPLSREFTGRGLKAALKGRKASVKQCLMDSGIVVGIGNIYASESLFLAGIDPRRAAGSISLERLEKLVAAIRKTLRAAIAAGGSSLRDFSHSNGELGCFQARHRVYDREGKPCAQCGAPIRAIRQGQRSTWFCPRCQR